MGKLFFFITVFFTTALTFSQQVTTVAGYGGGAFLDGPWWQAYFSGPWGLCTDPTGTIIYVADSFNHRIRKIDLTSGLVTTIAGSTEGYADGVGTAAKFALPRDVCMDSNGNLFVTDNSNHKIRKIDLSTNSVTTFAGSTQGYTNGSGTNAKFNDPVAICIDSNNNLYVSEWQGNKIRKITPTGQVTNLAGSGVAGFADGVGTNAKFYAPQGLCVDNQNNIYVSDTVNFRVRKITPSGTVTTIAGTGEYGYLDGAVATAMLGNIKGICMDTANNLYVADEFSHLIRKIDLTTNMVSTFLDTITYTSNPKGICLKDNTIYFTGFSNCKVFKITDVLSNDRFNKSDFYLFPNPNNGSFNINRLQSGSIEIYDILGKLVFTKKEVNAANQIVTELKKGICLVKITNEDGKTVTQKIVVE